MFMDRFCNYLLTIFVIILSMLSIIFVDLIDLWCMLAFEKTLKFFAVL